jgi:hypothetical protein
MLALTITPD